MAVVKNVYDTGPSTKNPLAAKAAVRRGSVAVARREVLARDVADGAEAQIEPQARSILRGTNWPRRGYGACCLF